MALLSYSTEAKRDLVDIGFYIAERNPAAAQKTIAKILASCENLKTFPLSCQLRPDIRPTMRHLVIGNYLALYQVTGDDIEIVRIVHGARYFPELL